MKINVYTVDFETPRWLRKAIACVVPIGLVCGASVAYANVKHTFQANEVLKATDLNDNFTDLDKRVTALEAKAVPQLSEWQSYVSAVDDAANGNPLAVTSQAFYRRVGDSIEAHVRLTNPTDSLSVSYMAMTIPSGLSVDGAKMAGLGGVGTAAYYQAAGNTTTMCTVFVGNALQAVLVSCGGSLLTPSSLKSGDELAMRFTVPISGWTTTAP
jgi:hypothetical protein